MKWKQMYINISHLHFSVFIIWCAMLYRRWWLLFDDARIHTCISLHHEWCRIFGSYFVFYFVCVFMWGRFLLSAPELSTVIHTKLTEYSIFIDLLSLFYIKQWKSKVNMNFNPSNVEKKERGNKMKGKNNGIFYFYEHLTMDFNANRLLGTRNCDTMILFLLLFSFLLFKAKRLFSSLVPLFWVEILFWIFFMNIYKAVSADSGKNTTEKRQNCLAFAWCESEIFSLFFVVNCILLFYWQKYIYTHIHDTHPLDFGA